LRCNAFWRHRTSLKLIVRYFRSSGHLVASLGLAIRLNRDWLPHLRPKTGGGCTLGLRLGFNDLSLFRIRHYSAHHSRNYAYCYSLFRQVLSHAKLGLRFSDRKCLVPRKRLPRSGQSNPQRGYSCSALMPFGTRLVPTLYS